MVTENQKLISNILFNQKKKTNHQKFHNTFSLVMITLLETIGMGTLLICDQPLRQHPRKVIRSIRSKYRSSHNNNNNSSSHSNKTIATIICTIKVSSNPLLMLRLLVGQRQLLLHLRPLELRLHLFCTNLKFRIPHLPLQCLSKEW